MPITVVTPTSGQNFGPGFTFQVSTDLIGPQPPGTFWMFELSAPAGEEVMTRRFIPFLGNTVAAFMVNRSSTFMVPTEARPEWTSGASGRFRAELIQDGVGTIESANVSVTIDRETGQVVETTEYIEFHQTSGGTGLSEEEHAAILQTNVGVIAMAGFDVAQLVGALGSALSEGPPLGIGSLSGPYTLTGDGELPDLHAAFQDRLGVYWIATVIPPGLSHRHGQSEEYPGRLVQWRTVHVVGGLEMVTEVVDAITHGELWEFRKKLPERVEYSILPGVTIQARWWQFP